MVKQKKYYWLKLQKDFFKRHDVRIIESMDNGESYILFYLKLLVESIDHEGQLRFSETIPYNEKMLSTITNTNIDIVRSAVKIFTELGLMETLTDETIYMSEISKMIGAESVWAKKKRLYREEQNLLIEENNGFSHGKEVNNDKSEDNVLNESSKCPNNVRTFSDKSKSKSIELDKDYKEKNTKKENYYSCENLSYFFDDDFQEAWSAWMNVRKKKKAVNSERAMNIIYGKLKDISKEIAIQMLDKSIVGSWSDVYESSKSFKPFNPEKIDKFKGEANFEL